MHANRGHEARLLHLTRFRLRSRESKPPSPPHGGGEGSCGGRIMESCNLHRCTRTGAMNRGCSTSPGFDSAGASRKPSPPHGGGEGSSGEVHRQGGFDQRKRSRNGSGGTSTDFGCTGGEVEPSMHPPNSAVQDWSITPQPCHFCVAESVYFRRSRPDA